MSIDDIKEWSWLIATAGATLVTITYFAYSFASNLINSMEIGFKSVKKSDTYIITCLAITFFLFWIVIRYTLKFSASNSGSSSYSIPFAQKIAMRHLFVLSIVFLIELSFFKMKIKSILNDDVYFMKYKSRLFSSKNKYFDMINTTILLSNLYFLASIYFNMFTGGRKYSESEFIFIVIFSVIIYVYTIMVYGINETIMKLLKLKTVIFVLKEDKNYSIECKILHIKNDFIYYIYNGELACVNKSKVLDIKNIGY